jgi:DNA-binding transcriptional regulator YhcF (GntR family)
MIEKHKSVSLADCVFERLENDILGGKYAYGEVLTEARLCEEMGVSRTPVREAIRRLQQENILCETGKGVVVNGITKDDIRPEFITSLYESTVVFGTVREIEDDGARMDCLISVLEKYMPQVMEEGRKYIQDSWDAVACFELEIEHITGKFGTE